MGVLINGKYYPDKKVEKRKPSTTIDGIYEDGKITRMAKEHAHDLIQPNNPDGTPNQDFIDYYPEDAKRHGLIEEEHERV